MMKEDCFACRKIGNGGNVNCAILTETICARRKCPFYKTVEEYVKGYEGYPEYESICLMYGVKPKNEA